MGGKYNEDNRPKGKAGDLGRKRPSGLTMKMQETFDINHIRCSHNTTLGHEMEAMHIHDVYEIYMSQCSGIKFLVNDRIYELECGDVMLFANTDLHKVSVPPKSLYQRHVITFPPQLLPREDRAELLACFNREDERMSHRIRMNAEAQNTFLALLKELEEEERQKDLKEMGQRLALCRILLFLNRICRENPQTIPASLRSQDGRIRAVMEYVDMHYSRQITLDELSGLCYLNKHYLCRLFRRETGFCIQDYIVYRRLSAALTLLREGKSVSATAQLSGFQSDSYFITTFKKHFGVTPRRYEYQE